MAKVALRGQKVHGKRKLRIQGRMQIFEKMSQMALNHDLRPDSESWDRDLQSGSVKTRFKAICDIFFEKMHATLDSQLTFSMDFLPPEGT